MLANRRPSLPTMPPSVGITAGTKASWIATKRKRPATEGPFKMELHVLRLGDVAIATNWFELYTDYGVRIKARSPAVQTFVIQLTGSGGYLPSERAVRGGGYGAVIQSSRIGPEGGQVLVDRTADAINALWPTSK